MAALFKVGQEVKLIVDIPQGAVSALSVNQDGEIQYLISYKDAIGVNQSRWFNEKELVKV